MFSVSVCAPAYNEEAGIGKVLESWLACLEQGIQDETITEYEIVLCDDGSKDNTINVVSSIKSNRIKLIQNPNNQGAGIAIKKAIQASSKQFVITIDSDGQFDLNEALNWLKGASVEAIVFGYREKADRFLLRLGSKLSNKLFELITAERIHDANCMLKLLPGDLARNLDLRAAGLNYSGEMSFLVCTSNSKVAWRPVSHLKRTSGKSSARFFKDGINRIKFQLFLLYEHRLVKSKILSKRNIH
jgi:glycosyltransferase involved in cell wall biosynthesis